MSRSNRKWSPSEETVILRYVKNYPHNLKKCFMMVSEQLTDEGFPRTPTAVQARWYSHLSKESDALCFFAASTKKVNKNHKNDISAERNNSIWKRMLNILRNLQQCISKIYKS